MVQVLYNDINIFLDFMVLFCGGGGGGEMKGNEEAENLAEHET